MSKILTNKENLLKNGYCIVRNLLSDKEVERAKSIINKISKINEKKLNMDMYKYRESWEFFTNDRLLNIVKNLLGPEIFYLHTCLTRRENEEDVNYTWHRDNPCRMFGKGPDWDEKEPYNVLSIIIYLSSSENTGSGLNLIPRSHKKTYTFSNLLRILHFKTKYISILKNIRDLFPKYLVGVNIKTEPGDCVIFLANLLHTAIPTHGLRKAIIFQYGTDNKHSKNYVNYYEHYRKQTGYENKYKDKIGEFFNFLKSKNIFFPLPEKKIEIKDVSIPKLR
jgi:ectoine hydroxylase-related dioxygenase (phytanoyl-CoA dioxygenase family)